MEIDDVNVVVSVTLNYVVTLGLYNGPISKELLAEHIASEVSGNSLCWVTDRITKVEVLDLHKDDNTPLVEGAFGR